MYWGKWAGACVGGCLVFVEKVKDGWGRGWEFKRELMMDVWSCFDKRGAERRDE